MPVTRELQDADTFRFRTTQGNVDFLTAFALLDGTTLGQQARRAIDAFLDEPDEPRQRDLPIEQRRLIRTIEMHLEPEMAINLGALAIDRLASVDQTMHDVFRRYFHDRLDSLDLSAPLERVVSEGVPPAIDDL